MNRQDAWTLATYLLNPIVDEHGLETLAIGGPFAVATKISPAEQRVDLIFRVAEWLMDDPSIAVEAHVGCSEETLFKVRESLKQAFLPDQQIDNAINEMQNAGILFRERV